MPLYQGGAAGARVRQAQAIRGQLLEQSIAVERLVVSNTRAAFAAYQSANEAIESNTIAVAANELALEGTRAEQTVGTRNILDVLNAEQELLNSQVLLVTARRDAYVAGFQLLERDGHGRGGGSQPRRRRRSTIRRSIMTAIRAAGRTGTTGRGSAPVATRTVPADANSPVTPIVNRTVTEPR